MTSPPESSRNWLGSLWGGAGAIAWVAGLGLLLLELWRRPQDVYSVPPIGYLIASLLVLALLGRRLSWLLWAYWAAAALTLLWSVAAGHTLLALQWELVFLAFAVAGLWRPGFWLLAVSLLVMGLDSTVLFSVFGFLAGGESLLLYQAGAEALLLVAPGLVLALNAKRPLWLRVLGGLVVAAALFVALASGARAVYLPLVVIMVLASWRLLRGGGVSGRRLAAVVAVLIVALMAADLLVPARPVTTALQRNVPGLAPAAVASDPDRQSRNVVWRVRMAEQTLAITAAHPQGTGVGSFPAVIHRYQRYPMLWSNSAHNFYLETLATGGPLRLLLLLAILGTAVVAGWRTERWPVALGVAGYWVTLAFDVGNLSPGFMAVGFWGLGYLLAKPAELPAWSRPRAIPGCLGVVVGVVAVAWWYLPCDHTDCALDRHLAFPRSVTQGFGQISEAEQDRVLAEAAKRYPESFWVATLTLRFAGSPERQLAAARDVAVRFPFQHPDRYLDWADFAHEAGDVAEERAALKQGLAIFYEDAWVARGRRLTGGGYLRRVERMRTQLAALKGD